MKILKNKTLRLAYSDASLTDFYNIFAVASNPFWEWTPQAQENMNPPESAEFPAVLF